MKYSELKHKNSELDLDFHQELEELYIGGPELNKNAKKYLPSLVNESDVRYKARLKIPCYINYFSQIVGQYINGLFSEDLSIVPAADSEDPTTPGELPTMEFWEDFDKDSDLKENPFKDVLKCALRSSLIHKKSYLAVDFPNFGFAESLKQESQEGFDRAYLVEICLTELIDWKYSKGISKSIEFGEDGKKTVRLSLKKLDYAKLYRSYIDDGVFTEEFKIWRKDLINNQYVISWQLYQVKWEDLKRPPKDEENFEPIEEGLTPQFTEIPFIELCLSDDLWIGGKIYNLIKLIWQRTSILLAAEDSALVQIPIAYLGPEIPEVDGATAENQTDPHRGHDIVAKYEAKGYVVLGSDDKVEYLVPATGPFEFIDQQVSNYVDEMFRICYLMAVSPIQTAKKDAGSSGAAKKEDRFAFNQALLNLGDITKSFCLKIYNFISAARKEVVVWVARGLDDFDVYDPAELLNELKEADNLPLRSKTWKTEYKLYLMNKRLKNLPPETMEQIRKEEFETGIDEVVNEPVNGPSISKSPASMKPNTENKET